MEPHRGGIVVSAVWAAAMLAGCGGDGSKVFGDQPGPCPAVESSYDETAFDTGADCFISEVRGGSPVVWDVIRGLLKAIRFRSDMSSTATR